MRELSAEYLAAAKSDGRYPNCKVEIDDGETLNGNNQLIDMHITKGMTAKPEYFDTMLALSSECRITVDRRRLNNEAAIVSGKRIRVYSAFNNPGGSEIGSALLGTFFISSYDKSDKVTGIITASDALLYTGVDFNPEGLTYPLSMSDMLTEAFAQSGITLTGVTLPVDPHVKRAPYKAEEPIAEDMKGSPYTCREIVARIAGINLGPLYIDAEGTPKITAYSDAGSSAITDSMIIDARIGSEEFYVSQIVVFKSEERMAKKNTSYLKLAYSPRFENMDSVKSGSEWRQQMSAAAAELNGKRWTTATVTIRGVGEIELGDVVTASGANLLISGITYDFANACFNETLYSFAWTYEEYLKTHPPIVNAAGTATSVQNFKGYADPVLNVANVVRYGDMWAKTEAVGSTVLSTMYKRVPDATDPESDGKWEEHFTVSSGSGGVGEAVGNHSERFNYYGTDYGVNTIDDTGGSGGNTARGQSNNMTGCSFSETGGYGNTVKNVRTSIVYGDDNNIDTADSCAFLCRSVTKPTRAPCNSSAFFGTGHTINNIFNNSFISGDNITINAPTSNSAFFGQNHKQNVGYATGLLVSGVGATIINERDRIVLGNDGNVFTVQSGGEVYASEYNTTGADYAEMFEWLDGNPDNEDRRGMLVTFSGDKIIPAHGDNFTGIISAAPSVLGNNPLEWHEKYKTDVFGAVMRDEKGNAIISEEYDPDREYKRRSERPEWSPVGLMGRLVIVDDGSCIPGEFVSARQGRGTKCYKNTGARVLRRLDDTHVEVLFGGR